MFKFDWLELVTSVNKAIRFNGLEEDFLENLPDFLIRAFIYRKWQSLSDNPQMYVTHKDIDYNYFSNRLRKLCPTHQIIILFEFFKYQKQTNDLELNSHLDWFMDLDNEETHKTITNILDDFFDNWKKFSLEYSLMLSQDVKLINNTIFHEFRIKMNICSRQQNQFYKSNMFFCTHLHKMFYLFAKYYFGAYPEFDKYGGIYTKNSIKQPVPFFKLHKHVRATDEIFKIIRDNIDNSEIDMKNAIKLIGKVEKMLPDSMAKLYFNSKDEIKETSFNWCNGITSLLRCFNSNNYTETHNFIASTLLAYTIETINGGGKFHAETHEQVQITNK